MGWLEVLQLLKRLLPLLTRIAPMLEGLVVARAGNGNGAEAMERIAAEVRSATTSAEDVAAARQAAVSGALAKQAEQLRLLAEDVRGLTVAGQAYDARMDAIASTLRGLTKAVVAAIALLVLCACLLLALVFRH